MLVFCHYRHLGEGVRTTNTELYALGETDLSFYLLLAQSESALCGLTWPYIVAMRSEGNRGGKAKVTANIWEWSCRGTSFQVGLEDRCHPRFPFL